MTSDNIFAQLPWGPFQTIVADPPWAYNDNLGAGLRKTKKSGMYPGVRSAESQYPTLTLDQLKSLPVQSVVADRAHLYLWTTNSFMVEAHELARAWGFEPKTILTWVKMRNDGRLPRIGMGFYFRGTTEHVLFCTRGTPALRLLRKDLPNVFFEPLEPGHSSKPKAFYDVVEQASPPEYLELFARGVARPRWSNFGNEVILPEELV